MIGDRTLPRGIIEAGYRFQKSDMDQLKLGSDPIQDPVLLFQIFTALPILITTEAHMFSASVGVTDQLTTYAKGGFVFNRREQVTEDQFFVTESSSFADTELGALWEFYNRGPYRAHFSLAGMIPTGSVEERSDDPTRVNAVLPYDIQIGTGSWALAPGLGFLAMNEAGAVGALARGVFNLNDNSRGYRLGNSIEANGWASYRFNPWLAVNARVHALSIGAIQNGDPELETLRDPGELGVSFGRTRVEIPVGMNIYMAEGRLQGHRLGVEGVWTVHEEVDGPLLANGWGFVFSWQKEWGVPFNLF